jgi:hypothetical protein
MLKFVKKYFIYIVVVLIIIILGVSLYGSRTNYEGFTIPDESQYKTFNSHDMNANPLSGSEISAIMVEIVSNISSHDTKLNMLDPTFTTHDLTMDPDPKNTQNNVTKILEVVQSQDKEILKLLSTYVPSPDLAGLIDGSLLKDKQTKLYNLSHYPFSPRDCSLNIMQKDLTNLQAQVAALPPAPAPPGVDTTREMLKSQITMKTQDMTDLKNNLQDPHFTKCNPSLSTSDADSIYTGYQLKYISNIVMLQDTAINKIQQSMAGSIVNSWSNLYSKSLSASS